eukprot:TRINITY_DN15913_c0_g1_i1.p1 TRINITY_DN15913_c0_g1~~TRINITY_DN15913_c0_g1_i1.p1  ORF type:complete len:202 (-),score=24.57 TRINITY_DN15913_c0_g1_i1:279-884(-)
MLVMTQRPLLPMESLTYRAKKPDIVAMIRFCSEVALRIVVVAAPEIGTVAEIRSVCGDADGSVVFEVAGLYAAYLGRRDVVSYREPSGRCHLVNAIAVEPMLEPPLKDLVDRERAQTLKSQIVELMKKLGLIGATAEAAEAAPADLFEFSWWAVARLPLPPQARGSFLRVKGIEERLRICVAVFTPFTRASAGKLPLRAKL